MGKRKKKAKAAAQPLKNKQDGVPTDVLGSYTGIAADGGRPVQDADYLSGNE